MGLGSLARRVLERHDDSVVPSTPLRLAKGRDRSKPQVIVIAIVSGEHGPLPANGQSPPVGSRAGVWHGVPRLRVVPNEVGADGLSMLTTAGEDFSRVLTYGARNAALTGCRVSCRAWRDITQRSTRRV